MSAGLVAGMFVLIVALLLSDGFQGLANWWMLLLDKLGLLAMYATLGIVIVLILGALGYVALGTVGCGLAGKGFQP